MIRLFFMKKLLFPSQYQIENFNFPLLIYDHQCPFCFQLTKKLQAGAKFSLSTLSLHDQQMHRLLEMIPSLQQDHCHKDVHLIDYNFQKQIFHIYRGHDVLRILSLNWPNPISQGDERSTSLKYRFFQSALGTILLKLLYKGMQNYRLSFLKTCSSCTNK